MKKTIAIAAAAVAGLLALAAAVDQRDLAVFTSNIPVIVLRADRAGAISNSKVYSPFTMEIYEPRPGAPVRLSDGPTSTARTGVRVRGQVSRLFP